MEELITNGRQTLKADPQERMTATELAAFRADFDAHFRLEKGTDHVIISNTQHKWPWQAIQNLFSAHSAYTIAGLMFNYGLNEAGFIPLLELFYIDTANNDALTLVPDGIYRWTSHGFEKIKKSDRDQLVSNYVSHVKVKRTEQADFSLLTKDEPQPDPRGTWYPLVGKVNELLADNPKMVDDRHLVISCIAPELTYDAMRQKTSDAKEYRHMLALHVAKPEWVDNRLELVDQLDDDPHSAYFAMRAMDIGCLCPPNCLK